MAHVFKNVHLERHPTARTPEVHPSGQREGLPSDALPAEREEERSARHELAVLRAELDELKGRIRKEGYAAGYEEGLSAAQAKLALEVARFDRLLKEVHAQLMKPLVDQEAVLVEIVLTGMARLLGEQLADRGQCVKILRQALASYGDKLVTALHVSNEDFEYLAKAGVRFDDYPQLTISASSKVTMGGCLIETSNGFADARAETQLERIRSVLHHARASAEAQRAHDTR